MYAALLFDVACILLTSVPGIGNTAVTCKGEAGIKDPAPELKFSSVIHCFHESSLSRVLLEVEADTVCVEYSDELVDEIIVDIRSNGLHDVNDLLLEHRPFSWVLPALYVVVHQLV